MDTIERRSFTRTCIAQDKKFVTVGEDLTQAGLILIPILIPHTTPVINRPIAASYRSRLALEPQGDMRDPGVRWFGLNGPKLILDLLLCPLEQSAAAATAVLPLLPNGDSKVISRLGRASFVIAVMDVTVGCPREVKSCRSTATHQNCDQGGRRAKLSDTREPQRCQRRANEQA